MRLRLLKSVLKNYYKEDRPKIQSYTPFPLTPLSKLGASIMGVKKMFFTKHFDPDPILYNIVILN